MPLLLKEKLRFVKTSQIAEFAFVMYFANAMLRTFFRWIFGGNNLIAIVMTLIMLYIPVLLLCLINPKKYFKLDVLFIFLWIAFFFGLTIFIHPKYESYFNRPIYGVWDYVLIPYRGIYAYLFVRLLDNPKKIMTCMEKTGWLMFVYFIYQIIVFFKRGYWYGVDGSDGMAKLSYSVSFGYEILPFALTFLYKSLKERKITHIIATILNIIMILIGGPAGRYCL